MSSVFSLALMDVLYIWLIAVVIITQKVSQIKPFELLGNFLICGAGWVKKSGIGKLLQWEESGKQTSWVKKSGNGKLLQWGEVEKQASWVKKSGIGELLQWEE